MTDPHEIADNLGEVRSRIESAAKKAGRSLSEVRLVAVSKTKPVEMLRSALAANQKIFGENYVQELIEKSDALSEAEFHFIGSLQTNKVKQLMGRARLIHSVDRLKLVEEIAKQAVARGEIQDILLQVHIGDEETKHGVLLEEAPQAIEKILVLPSLKLRGAMSLPPLTEDEAQARRWFAQLREASDRWKSVMGLGEDFHELSIGTSSDYEWAILEGATLVRVGTAIFGARERK